ncbi:MAG: hypothetical protein GY719_05420, partial [bacterium]|nr:hypothetical protein [bacterium]
APPLPGTSPPSVPLQGTPPGIEERRLGWLKTIPASAARGCSRRCALCWPTRCNTWEISRRRGSRWGYALRQRRTPSHRPSTSPTTARASIRSTMTGFRTVRAPRPGGVGIGLALVRRIVEVHDAKVWVESDGKGRGATFCLTLPRPTSQNH